MNWWPSIAQQLGLLRQLMPIVGTLVTTMGWISPEDWDTWSQVALKVSGPLMIFISSVWTLFANNKTSMIKSVAAMSETSVSPGGATITINDRELAKTAMKAGRE